METANQNLNLLIDPTTATSNPTVGFSAPPAPIPHVLLNKSNLLPSRGLLHKPLNWERYQDLEQELNKEILSEFISGFATKYKSELK
jgi:hypothetical protein